jgi:hypothetical protein
MNWLLLLQAILQAAPADIALINSIVDDFHKINVPPTVEKSEGGIDNVNGAE